MGNQSIVRIKNFQADYDFRICNLSVSIYCVGSGNLVLDMINKQTKELVLENIEVRDGTQSIQCDLDNGIYNFKIYEVVSREDVSDRYLLYEANFTYSNPYDAKDGEIIIKNIKYKCEVISVNEFAEDKEIDAVIVSPVQSFEAIRENLKNVRNVEIVSLEEVINYYVF